MLKRTGPRSWAPDFVFPEPAFRPLAEAEGVRSGGKQQSDELRAALRAWDSVDPAALLRVVMLVIDRWVRSECLGFGYKCRPCAACNCQEAV